MKKQLMLSLLFLCLAVVGKAQNTQKVSAKLLDGRTHDFEGILTSKESDRELYIRETPDSVFIYEYYTTPLVVEKYRYSLYIYKLSLTSIKDVKYYKADKSSSKPSLYFYFDEIPRVTLFSEVTLPNKDNEKLEITERVKQVFVPLTNTESWKLSQRVNFDNDANAQQVSKRIKASIKKMKSKK